MAAVQVVGRGAVSALGLGCDALLDGVFAGRTGLKERRRLADTPSIARFAGEVPADYARAAGDETELPRRMAVDAAREALNGVGPEVAAGPDVALVLASTKADLAGIVGPAHREAPDAGLGCAAFLARQVAQDLGLTGEVRAVSNACGSGLTAIALAARWIATGRQRQVLVVGVDALCGFVLRGFDGLMALDRGRCRPFDRTRAGLTLGEGAGALLLRAVEDEPSREASPSRVLIRGWGEATDAHHITAPRRDGQGLRRACEAALQRAGLGPADVDVVHLHGTGTQYNDAMELRAMESLLGDAPGEGEAVPPRHTRVVAAGTKAQTGHTLGAAGLLEAVIVCEILRRQQCPAHVGLTDPEPCEVLELPASPRPIAGARVALKVCAGFGGLNSALVFTR